MYIHVLPHLLISSNSFSSCSANPTTLSGLERNLDCRFGVLAVVISVARFLFSVSSFWSLVLKRGGVVFSNFSKYSALETYFSCTASVLLVS